jgi:phosphoketolase
MNEATITEQQPLSRTELQTIDAYWRAANYLSVGQIYLLMTDKRIEARAYTREFGEDAPEINNWAWPQ